MPFPNTGQYQALSEILQKENKRKQKEEKGRKEKKNPFACAVLAVVQSKHMWLCQYVLVDSLGCTLISIICVSC